MTRVVSATDFDVSGVRIICGDATSTRELSVGNILHQGCPRGPLYIGEALAVFGKLHSKSIEATKIEVRPLEVSEMAGSAVVDAIINRTAGSSPELTVRSDGYRIRLQSNIPIDWLDPLHTLGDVRPGD